MTRSERTAYRVLHRLCVDCGAGLQLADGRYCVEHLEIRIAAKTSYRASVGGKATERRAQKRRYAARVARGGCASPGCPLTPVSGRRRCAGHFADHAAWQVAYEMRREEAGAA